jgi:MYXO-CTERM domain-containing protein
LTPPAGCACAALGTRADGGTAVVGLGVVVWAAARRRRARRDPP